MVYRVVYINVNINRKQRTYRFTIQTFPGISGANRILRMSDLIMHMGNNAAFHFS
jgi:hypothetical protein